MNERDLSQIEEVTEKLVDGRLIFQTIVVFRDPVTGRKRKAKIIDYPEAYGFNRETFREIVKDAADIFSQMGSYGALLSLAMQVEISREGEGRDLLLEEVIRERMRRLRNQEE